MDRLGFVLFPKGLVGGKEEVCGMGFVWLGLLLAQELREDSGAGRGF